jgi:DNA-3-methyladenine glycosylase
VLVTDRGGLTAGRIVETEAYLGPEDGASHAAFRPSSRPLFYGPGGFAYVFSAYGLHGCLNAIAGPPGEPGCVLIRALEPLTGRAIMARRRGLPAEHRRLTTGPGNLTCALAITVTDTGLDLTRGQVTIRHPHRPLDFAVVAGPRVGITRSADLPLRFRIADDPFVSR